MANDIRPTSPHLGIYRWQISMTMSIMHRITGMALYAGTALIVFWLWSAAYAPSYYSTFRGALNSVIGQLALLGWTLAFYYHLGNGIRHLFWDMGKGFALPVMQRTGWLVILFALLMSALTWFIAYTSTGTLS